MTQASFQFQKTINCPQKASLRFRHLTQITDISIRPRSRSRHSFLICLRKELHLTRGQVCQGLGIRLPTTRIKYIFYPLIIYQAQVSIGHLEMLNQRLRYR